MLEHIPQDLQHQQRWVCFDASKHPINPRTGGNAMPNNPSTWSNLATAQQAVARLALKGVGIMLGDGLCGIDIDHCIDPETGQASDLAREIVEQMDTYTEVSPSGTGLHLLFFGEKPGPACRRTDLGLELYSGRRYFTVTGRVYRDRPLELRSEAVAAVYAKYLEKPKPAAAPPCAPQPAPLEDSQLLELAKGAKDGERFAALYAGSWQGYYQSQSEADLSFCNLLAFWFGCDIGRMDAVFRASGLYRPKWDERRGAKTYGQATLERAVADCQQVYTPRPAQAAEGFADQTQAIRELTAKYGHTGAAPGTPPGKKSYSQDDTGNARRFADLYRDQLRYNPTDRTWLVWDGKRWRKDDTAAVKRLADEMLDGMEKSCFGIRDTDAAASLRRHVQHSRSSKGKEAFLKEAQHLEGIPLLPAQCDRNKGLFNLENGILDLAHQKLLPHDRARAITRLAPVAYDPAAKCPSWEAFIRSVTGGDQDLARYLQAAVGYFLSGATREQCMFFLYGDGSNGKSTFLETLQKLFGDYCMNAQAETITSSRTRSSGAARSDVARLKGARLVTIEEGDEGAMLDEGLVKQMTGGNTITARFQYGKEFEFRPEFKLVMATNHKPRIRGTDTGIWRRIRLIPFTQHIPPEKQDMLLPQKLERELPGILNWAVEGLRLWLQNSQGGRRHGLPPCAAVENATAEYRLEQDRLQTFLDECVEPAPGQTLQAGALFHVYDGWCRENNERYSLTSTRFGLAMKKRFAWKKGRYFNEYLDIKLTGEGLRYFGMRGPAAGALPSAGAGEPLYTQTSLKS